MNSEMGTFVRGLGGSIVAHPDIKFDHSDHFLDDGVHFAPMVNYIFLNSIVQSLKATI